MPGIPLDRHSFLKNRHGFIIRGINLRRGMKAGNGTVWTMLGRSGDLPPDDLVPGSISGMGSADPLLHSLFLAEEFGTFPKFSRQQGS